MDATLEKQVVDPTLAEMGKNLNEAMKMLEDSQRKVEEENEKKYARKDIPGPLQGSGQDMVSILQLVQNLMHGEEEEESSQAYRLQNVGEQGHMALLGHSLAAYISVLDKERLRKLTTRILSDTTLWLCRLFRYENGSAYYHEDDREGLLKICRLVIHTCYEDYTVEGFNVLCTKQPVIYISSAARTGLGQALCNQLGLPLSCMCRVPCNTMFGSQHQMDVALLDRLIKDDVECGKLPLLLVANAGTPGAGHTDKLGRLKELCEQYNMWLHVEGVNLATLALGYVSSSVLAATKCDSMTLTLGSWLGLPAVPAVTLYKHEDPSLSLVAGLTSSQPVEKLRALPLWLSLQYLGHDGIVERIKHASQLSQRLLENLKNLDFIKTSVEDELSSPVVVFKFFQKYLNRDLTPHAAQTSAIQHPVISNEGHIYDTFNQWLGDQLAQMVPASGIDVVELEDEGTCVRFSPLMTSAVLGTEIQDVDQLVDCLKMKIPVLTSTLQLREEFEQEVRRTVGLLYIEDLSWPGLGVVSYHSDEKNNDNQEKELEKINTELLKKLNELESDLTFSLGPEFGGQKNCVYIGMVTEDLDVSELVETIAATGREIEENSRLLENMTEVVRKGIQEAQLQLQKANEERLLEEGLLRQIPVVGSVLNWFSPFQASPKGRTFNLTAGSLESTESTYVSKAQGTGITPPPTPTSSLTKQKHLGQKIFKRSLRNSDAFSETSSVSHCDDMEKMDQRSPTLSPGQEQRPLEPEKTELLPKVVPQATNKDTEDIQSSKSLNDCTSVEEQGSQR
ncbi:pyridoxal-dependent decarboxylase domain-containing protein 1 isoform X3 [Gallus gallus]|uniref:pyridoxal-dependent decarboxylase domain-containing protein 1 isoform X3 n=1 Tax=Gallus gallus TaxID=9031 RepID=UPI0003505CBA|nr:pyridoxal-dependent decarboxylase domain-containing protein 1 isoform X3 [Gallus gallus]XP_040539794.1 pyridoxal-dependent decarboxylase domain-containing protein 1 isoform X3 [Gallus gallus]|eukprot:XP_004945125.1 pyridoxal-dependent decarboxylase domain-containing protein 1 isoform X3 [Gallus gallus]